MKKGFTLIEILFVLLVIALIVSFAAPAYRSVRFDIRNSRAKAALRKLAEARRSFYQQNKGVDLVLGSFDPQNARTWANGTCSQIGATGIPGHITQVEVSQLFACGFLNWRDFMDLPYTFSICSATSAQAVPCVAYSTDSEFAGSFVYAGAVAQSATASGAKYVTLEDGATTYYMYVRPDMEVRDNLN